MARFAEAFWNTEFCNFSGFEVLCQRMLHGRQMCKDLIDFFKQRAQAQEAYGKTLLKIARSAGGKDEMGSLKEAWEVLKSQTESIGLMHCATATALMEEVNKTLTFAEEQKEKRRRVEDIVRKYQSAKKAMYRKTMEFKKVYEAKCRESDQAAQQLQIELAKLNSHPKDVEKGDLIYEIFSPFMVDIFLRKRTRKRTSLKKLKQKNIKTTQIAEQADTAYKSAIDHLDQYRLQWEHEMAVGCEIFQQMEEERIKFLRNCLWVTANISSGNCVSEDEMNEAVRKSLEKCDVDADIQLFIKNSHTSWERPAPILYENYYNFGCEAKQRSSERPPEPLPLTVGPKPLKPPSHRAASSSSIQNIDDVDLQPGPLLINPNGSLVEYSIAEEYDDDDDDDDYEDDDPLYSSIVMNSNNNNRDYSLPPDFPATHRVIYPYDAQNSDELTLTTRQYVIVRNKNISDGWWEVETDDFDIGLYPSTYLEAL